MPVVTRFPLARRFDLSRACRYSDRLTSTLQSAGTAATSAVLQKQDVGPVQSIKDGSFFDYRWKDGRWDMSFFTGLDGKVDWDSVRARRLDGLICTMSL